MAKKSQIAKTNRPPKFSVRTRHRCRLCGRPRAFMQKFQICRICFRTMAHRGQIPGVKKASW